jgi:Mn2+/Fe2+ NRAMP family transporter
MFRLSKNIGPGFLLAGAAIGVSHLVQSTRAGAEYGWILIIALIVACISKYPFMMMGPRYTAATGQHLIEGYKDLGKFQYYTYMFLTLASMFIVLAAVTLVTGGLAAYFFPLDISVTIWCVFILLVCFGILFIGKYNALDKSMKVTICLLTVLTFLAVLMAVYKFEQSQTTVELPSLTTAVSIAFIVSFMGWMPIPVDASIWHSIWTKEKSVQTGKKTSAGDVILDFNIGYIGASVIAVLFFMLGVLVMHGRGMAFSNSSIAFSGQLVDIYATTLGQWTRPFIGFAAFITMFSTTISVADAFPRVISEVFILEKGYKRPKATRIYILSLLILSFIALLIIQFGGSQFKLLVDFAAGLSFLTAPFLAWFNFQLFQNKKIPQEFRLNSAFKNFSLTCLVFLILFNFIYLWSVFFYN